MKIRAKLTQLTLLGVCISLLAASSAHALGVFTWTGTAGDSLLENTNNWTPLTAGRPSSGVNDTLLWDGTVAGNLTLTNSLVANFDSNPGFYLHVAGGHTGSLTLVESNGALFASGTRIRLNGTNSLNVDSGAGAVSFGNGGNVGLPITLAGKGTGETHTCTNNSANTVTFNSDVLYVMGGGGAHTLLLAGTGNWQVNSSIQPINSAGLGLTVAGPGTVFYLGAPTTATGGGGFSYVGTYGNVTVAGGTLQLQSASALGTGDTLVLTGGNLDSSVVNLVNSGNNIQSWNGNFGFVGTQNLDLGFGPVTMNGNRVVTVSAGTLTVHGAIAGTGFSLTKSGAGTLDLTGANTYTGGTVISNGVLQMGGSSVIPTGTAAAESLTNYGTLDMNGNSPTISSLYGTGVVDTISGGTPTLTVGDQNAGGSFSGAIQNSAGSVALSKVGTGSLILGGASTYNGGTTVNAGVLLVTNTTGSATGSGSVTVSSGATFGGSGIVTGPVAWQSGSSASFTQGSPLTVSGSVILSGNSVLINVPGAIPLGAGTYPLMTYNTSGSSGSFSSSGLQFAGAGVSPGTSSSVSTSGGTVTLTVVSTVNGIHAAWTNTISGNWSVATNWSSNPSIPHAAGDLATLGFGSAYTTVTLDASESVGGVVFTNGNSFDVANAGNTLTFDNSGGGAVISVAAGTSNEVDAAVSLNDNLFASLYPGTALMITNTLSSTGPSDTISVSGGGTLTLKGNNTFGPSAGTIGSTLIGSTVQLSQSTGLGGGDVSVIGGSTVRALSAIGLANNVIVSNGATASFDNNGNSLQLSGTISGAGGVGKNGLGILTLNGANSYNGNTSISAGTVQFGNASAIPGGMGDGNVNMGTNTLLDLHGFSPTLDGINASFTSALIDNLSATPVTLTLGANGGFATYQGNIQNSQGAIALVLNDNGGQQTLTGTNTYSGGTTITAGTLQIGNGNTNFSAGVGPGPVSIGGSGTLQYNLFGTNVLTNAISGAGALNLNDNNLTLVLSNANPSFSGNINVNGGSLWVRNSTAMGVGPKNVNVANGTAGNSQLHLDGSLGNLTLDNSLSLYLSNVGGNLFNESGTNVINSSIFLPFGGGAAYIIVKSGFLTINGGVASDGIANGRTFQLGGAGNGLFTGVASDNAQSLGSLTKVDAGTWTVTGISTSIGALNANAGTLVLNGQWAGPVVVSSGGTLAGNGSANSNLTVNAGGIFVPGGYGSVGTFTVSNNMSLAGIMYASLNKSLAQSNTVVNVPTTGATNLTASSGSTLIVSNLGPALVTGDTFYLFSQAVTNGNLTTITGPANVTFTNNLAVNGSISVLTAEATNPTNITAVVSGGLLTLSWPSDHTGWYLQSQTNTLTTGLRTNWVDVAGSSTTNQVIFQINPANGAVFYRMSLNP